MASEEKQPSPTLSLREGRGENGSQTIQAQSGSLPRLPFARSGMRIAQAS